MELVEVERVDALLGAHQNVLVVRLGVDPRRRAVDVQRTSVENLTSVYCYCTLSTRPRGYGRCQEEHVVIE